MLCQLFFVPMGIIFVLGLGLGDMLHRFGRNLSLLRLFRRDVFLRACDRFDLLCLFLGDMFRRFGFTLTHGAPTRPTTGH